MAEGYADAMASARVKLGSNRDLREAADKYGEVAVAQNMEEMLRDPSTDPKQIKSVSDLFKLPLQSRAQVFVKSRAAKRPLLSSTPKRTEIICERLSSRLPPPFILKIAKPTS